MVESNLNYTERLNLMLIEYNSVRNYANLFADILCDVQADQPDIGENIIEGFKLAITELGAYHQDQAKEYKRLSKIVDEI